ncbi:GNAT family N-acetyltransferase [Clostridium tagluense]|uniref:GNAT family N-acetyltransferase n=1 Tax=Clostridium tagluense TaxID=360422 RepID=UPI001CF54ED2|nr:GNAT family N-acetyltransferase [Clostridium tagluense]MCB2314017.1 GNAT family N-acetyltransferase [Clostridium tagluense]MCB2318854.1 GNAT family N-acetyltransferase [Clostridium tagluense]MCB2323695.1 GNAT family N-acetyltransferase [Clostridium tagluense]MCB2328575.1 GNAT family N-acetyltransferase [Clostridium tagluense]MCB2333431.1 GNAT family N-acetyltransferase [Clostridium tagluense]
MDNHQHTITMTMKLELNQEDYAAIKALEAVCCEKQKTELKLELEFKMQQRSNSLKNKIMAEFLYYDNQILVGYLGLCNFHGTSVELSGMVHPEFRRKGIFKKLYLLAKEEWQKISPAEVLVLCDHTSLSGLAFINHVGAEYGSAEYKMCLNKITLGPNLNQGIELRMATNDDAYEIERQGSIYFGFPEEEVNGKEDLEKLAIQVDDNFISYMAELHGDIIGKVHISVTDNEGFIHGFGVLPEYRGKGYGRETLCLAVDILKKKQVDNIFLEVATENKKALGLYESCGFEEISVMDYYMVF